MDASSDTQKHFQRIRDKIGRPKIDWRELEDELLALGYGADDELFKLVKIANVASRKVWVCLHNRLGQTWKRKRRIGNMISTTRPSVRHVARANAVRPQRDSKRPENVASPEAIQLETLGVPESMPVDAPASPPVSPAAHAATAAANILEVFKRIESRLSGSAAQNQKMVLALEDYPLGMNYKQVAEVLGRSTSDLRRQVSIGGFPQPKTLLKSKTILFRRCDVLKWIECGCRRRSLDQLTQPFSWESPSFWELRRNG